MNTSIKSKGRGRTKGSFSFVTISLKELQSQVGSDTNIVLSRKWAESIGLKNAGEAKNSTQTLKQTVIPSSDATATPMLQVLVEE